MEKGTATKHDLKKAANTGDWRSIRPSISKEKCIGCGLCVGYCPEAVISLIDRNEVKKDNIKKLAEVDYDFCKGCGVCSNVCPVKAIVMKREGI